MLPVEDRRVWIKSRRKMRKRARHARLRRQVFRFFVLMAILIICVLSFSRLPWSIGNARSGITVRGNSFTAAAMVRETLADSVQVPLYELNPGYLQHRVEKLETIKHAYIHRYVLPRPHMIVELLEEYPWASLAEAPDAPVNAVIAESGRVIPVEKFPMVTRPSMRIFARSPLKMKAADVRQWATWISYIEEQTGQKVDSVDMRKPFDVRIADGDLYLKIGVPDTTLTRRLGRLVSIMPEVRMYKNRLEHIDLALENNVPLKLSKEPRDPQVEREHVPIASTGASSRGTDAL